MKQSCHTGLIGIAKFRGGLIWQIFELNPIFWSRTSKPHFPFPGSVPRPRECNFRVMLADTDRLRSSFSSNCRLWTQIVTFMQSIYFRGGFIYKIFGKMSLQAQTSTIQHHAHIFQCNGQNKVSILLEYMGMVLECPSGLQTMNPGTKLAARDATITKVLANSMSARPETPRTRIQPIIKKNS